MTVVPKVICNKTIMTGARASLSIFKQVGPAKKIGKIVKETTFKKIDRNATFALEGNVSRTSLCPTLSSPFHVDKKFAR